MLELGTCSETVSILYALIFGAGDACINLSIGSLLGLFAGFLLALFALQYLARRLVARMTRPPAQPFDPSDPTAPSDQPKPRLGQVPAQPYESPIKKSRF